MKRQIYNILLVISLMTCSSGTWAQNILKGTVTDQEGEALPGANVCFENINNRLIIGVVTNVNGEYFLQTSNVSNQKLKVVCSFIGFKTKTIEYTGQQTLNIVLESDMQTLDDVVVQGVTMERDIIGVPIKNLAVAHEKIELTEMESMPATSVEDALQGRMANVDIIASSGDPGSKMAIRIRGTSSLNASSEPLIVIDGIPYDTDIRDDFDFATANEEDFGALVNISPTDIASIEVLKDAAATAIWGSKGANGVLLINTKKGSRGKTRFSINQKLDYKREPNQIPMLDGKQYVTLIQDAMWNRMHDQGFNKYQLMNSLTKYPEINFDPEFVYFDEYNQNTNWIDLITQDGISSETNFSMSGGGDKAIYRFSLGSLNEIGTTIGTGFDRISSRLNIDYKFSQKLKVGASFSYSEGQRENNWSNNNLTSIRSHAQIKMPNMSPYVIDEDGSMTNMYFVPIKTSDYSPFQGTWDRYVFNPVAMAHDSYNRTTNRAVRMTFNLQYRLLNDLTFHSDIGFDISTSKTKKFLPQSATGVVWTDKNFNRADDLMSNSTSRNIINKLIYNKRFNEKHQIIFSGLNHIQEYYGDNYSSGVSGLGSGELGDPSNGGNIRDFGSGISRTRTIGMAINGHYNYDDRYLFNLGYRYDGNSRMGNDNRWGGFPSISFAWRLSEENFMEQFEWLSDAKARISWGQSGNSPSGSYPYIGKYSPIGSYGGISAVSPVTIQLNRLKWEVVTQRNFGLDLSFLEHKLDVTFDLYNKLTTDLLQKDVKVPSSTGHSKVSFYNSGEVVNYGWEFRVNAKNIIKANDLRVSFNFNLSRNRNKVLELPDNVNYEKYSFGNGKYAQNVVINNPIGAFYGYRFLGIYQTDEQTYARDAEGQVMTDVTGQPVPLRINNIQVRPGDAIYEDINHDGVIDKYDIVYLGNSMPIVTGGAGINTYYKGFSFRAFFHARFGQSVINEARMNSENMYGSSNQSTAVLKRWRFPGDDTEIPRAMWGRGYNYLGSDRFVDDATFIRLKQLSLSYKLPKEWVQKVACERVELAVTAYDVITWTNYLGQNPEVGLSGGIYQLAIDKSYTPRPIRYAFTLSVDF